jgi:hypothetical protein
LHPTGMSPTFKTLFRARQNNTKINFPCKPNQRFVFTICDLLCSICPTWAKLAICALTKSSTRSTRI